MDDLAKQSPAERGTYFMQAATELGLTPSIIEKDFWVCWILKRLFNLECVENHLLFKGGTSLSKAYKLIRRFSEDIDLSIHRASLGFEGKKDPATPGLSNKLRNRMIEALGMEARAKIQNEIQPELKELIREQLGSDEWNLERDPTDPDGQSLAFAYPRTSLTPETSAYIRPAVKIEFGARSDHWPAESKTLKPYVAEALPDAMEQVEVIVKAMSARRTFWEKATILHQMAHLPDHRQFPDRYSRHYADLSAMVTAQVSIAWIKGGHTGMNCKAVPLQSPVSHSAHWVEMDKNNEPQRGSTMHLTKFVVSKRRSNVGAGFLSTVEKHSCGRLLKIPE